MLKRFLTDLDKTPYEELLSLRQTDIVSTTVNSVMKETLTTLFMNGLVDDLKIKVMMFSPRTLEEIVDRVIQVDVKNWVIYVKMRL